jgi:hypothetical protein
MNIDPENIAAIASLGYTQEEARFLYIVAMHSGYFVPRQFLASSGAKWGKRSNHFAAKLESRGHATWREYHRTGGVYHLVSNTIYRRIGNENLRNRRRHSVEFIRTRLLLLDFILTNPSHHYLETETEKLRFFGDELGIPRTTLPAKTYEGSPHTEPTLRYFVDKFPLFVDRTESSPSPVATFSYVDPGQASLAGFANHLHAYLSLFRQLADFSFLYIANSQVHSVRADECFSSVVKAPLEADVSSEVLRYFRLRNAWESKKYGSLSTNDVEWLKEAMQRFHGDRFDGWYRAWSTGALGEQALRKEYEQVRPQRNVTFRTCVVTASRFGSRSPSGDKEAALHPASSADASRLASLPRSSQLGRKKRDEEQNGTQEDAAQTPDEGRVSDKELVNHQEETMALVKKPPETVSRTVKLDQPVSELLDEYCRFVDCTADYVTNFTLRKTLARDSDFKKWKATRSSAGSSAPGAQKASS